VSDNAAGLREVFGDAVVCCSSPEEIVAAIPSTFLDPERACPATTYYESAQAHGTLHVVTDLADKARALQALMVKYQPEGGHVPITEDHPLYRKAVLGLLVAELRIERLSGNALDKQNTGLKSLGSISADLSQLLAVATELRDLGKDIATFDWISLFLSPREYLPSVHSIAKLGHLNFCGHLGYLVKES
jgi:hypothetical protein